MSLMMHGALMHVYLSLDTCEVSIMAKCLSFKSPTIPNTNLVNVTCMHLIITIQYFNLTYSWILKCEFSCDL